MSGGETTGLVASDQMAVLNHRFAEALAAGLSVAQAELYAESDVSASVLRKLVRLGCEPGLIARIVR